MEEVIHHSVALARQRLDQYANRICGSLLQFTGVSLDQDSSAVRSTSVCTVSFNPCLSCFYQFAPGYIQEKRWSQNKTSYSLTVSQTMALSWRAPSNRLSREHLLLSAAGWRRKMFLLMFYSTKITNSSNTTRDGSWLSLPCQSHMKAFTNVKEQIQNKFGRQPRVGCRWNVSMIKIASTWTY